MCFDLVRYSFLKLSKIDISENLRFLRDAVGRARRLFYR